MKEYIIEFYLKLENIDTLGHIFLDVAREYDGRGEPDGCTMKMTRVTPKLAALIESRTRANGFPTNINTHRRSYRT